MTLSRFVNNLLDDLQSSQSDDFIDGDAIKLSEHSSSTSDEFLNMSILNEIQSQPPLNPLTKKLVYKPPNFDFSQIEDRDEHSDSFYEFLNELIESQGGVKKKQASQIADKAENGSLPHDCEADSRKLISPHKSSSSQQSLPDLYDFLSKSPVSLLNVKQPNESGLQSPRCRQSINRLVRVSQPAVINPPEPSAVNTTLEPPVSQKPKMLEIKPKTTRLNVSNCVRRYLGMKMLFQQMFPEVTYGFAEELRKTTNWAVQQAACSIYLDKSITDAQSAKFVDIMRQHNFNRCQIERFQERIGLQEMSSETLAGVLIAVSDQCIKSVIKPQKVASVRQFKCVEELRQREMIIRQQSKAKEEPVSGKGVQPYGFKQAQQRPVARSQSANVGSVKQSEKQKPALSSRSSSRQQQQTQNKVASLQGTLSTDKIIQLTPVQTKQMKKQQLEAQIVKNYQNAQKMNSYPSNVTKNNGPQDERGQQMVKIQQILDLYNSQHPTQKPLRYKEAEKLLRDAKIITDQKSNTYIDQLETQLKDKIVNDARLSAQPIALKIDANSHAPQSPKFNAKDSRLITAKAIKKNHLTLTQYERQKYSSRYLQEARIYSKMIASDDIYQFQPSRRVRFSQEVTIIEYSKGQDEMKMWVNNYLDTNEDFY